MESAAGEERRRHRFVLVHGMCHGAWCWYRVRVVQAHPGRVAVAVFASAEMPAAGKPMRFVSEQLRAQERAPGFFKDCVTETAAGDDPRQRPCKTFLLGPEYMAERLYQLSPPEPTRQFTDDDATMNGEGVLTAERYGAVSRVYVVAEEDACCPPEFQRRMASWNPGTEVRGLEGADHMPMFSKPRELSGLLVEIANKYN
uniref:Uncharacterized protein n=1 Tax=Avena sativa TaxID=4498 RepID=A0ACD5ZAC6_AVESA